MWALAAFIGLPTAVSVFEQLRPGAMSDVVTLAASQAFVYLLLVFVMLRIYEPESSIRHVIAARPVAAWVVLLAAAIGLGIYPALNSLAGAIENRFPLSAEDSEYMEKLFAVSGLGRRIGVVLGYAIVSPLVEQAFFYGILFGGIRRNRTLFAAGLAISLYVALSPGNPRIIPTQLALVLVLAWLRGWSGSLVASAAAHVAFFAVPAVQMLLYGKEVPIARVYMLAGGVGAILAATILHLALRRDPRARGSREADTLGTP